MMLLAILAAASAPAPPDALARAASQAPAGFGDTVVVQASTTPKVKATYPAQGSEAPPGLLVLKVVFDQRMDPAGWSYGRSGPGPHPDCLAKPRLLGDGSTFVLLCTVAPGTRYTVALNGEAGEGADGASFANPGRRKAAPYALSFTTGAEEPLRILREAVTQAGLQPQDGPVSAWTEAAPAG